MQKEYTKEYASFFHFLGGGMYVDTDSVPYHSDRKSCINASKRVFELQECEGLPSRGPVAVFRSNLPPALFPVSSGFFCLTRVWHNCSFTLSVCKKEVRQTVSVVHIWGSVGRETITFY